MYYYNNFTGKVCPRCGCNNCQIIAETESKTKGYGFCKGLCGFLIFDFWGLLCGLCGMGKSKSKTRSYWVCPNCGNKFKV